MSQPNRNPKKQTLAELKAQLQNSQPIIVDSSGQLKVGSEQAATIPAAAQTEPAELPKDNTTRVKPSRWFA